MDRGSDHGDATIPASANLRGGAVPRMVAGPFPSPLAISEAVGASPRFPPPLTVWVFRAAKSLFARSRQFGRTALIPVGDALSAASLSNQSRGALLTEIADPEPPLRRLQYENRKEAAKA